MDSTTPAFLLGVEHAIRSAGRSIFEDLIKDLAKEVCSKLADLTREGDSRQPAHEPGLKGEGPAQDQE